MKPPDKLIDIFHQKGLRITPQRRYIFELLADDDSHPRVDDIFQQIREKMPEVTRATVYNTVHELVSLGELHEVDDPFSDSTRYDIKTEQHHHLYCEKCHKLSDLTEDLGQVHLLQKKLQGYLITRSQITFYGICPECQKGVGEIREITNNHGF